MKKILLNFKIIVPIFLILNFVSLSVIFIYVKDNYKRKEEPVSTVKGFSEVLGVSSQDESFYQLKVINGNAKVNSLILDGSTFVRAGNQIQFDKSSFGRLWGTGLDMYIAEDSDLNIEKTSAEMVIRSSRIKLAGALSTGSPLTVKCDKLSITITKGALYFSREGNIVFISLKEGQGTLGYSGSLGSKNVELNGDQNFTLDLTNINLSNLENSSVSLDTDFISKAVDEEKSISPELHNLLKLFSLPQLNIVLDKAGMSTTGKVVLKGSVEKGNKVTVDGKEVITTNGSFYSVINLSEDLTKVEVQVRSPLGDKNTKVVEINKTTGEIEIYTPEVLGATSSSDCVSYSVEEKLLCQLNSFRLENGRAVLGENLSLDKIALGHSNLMASEDALTQQFPDEDSLLENLFTTDLTFSKYGMVVGSDKDQNIDNLFKSVTENNSNKTVLLDDFSQVGIGINDGYLTIIVVK